MKIDAHSHLALKDRRAATPCKHKGRWHDAEKKPGSANSQRHPRLYRRLVAAGSVSALLAFERLVRHRLRLNLTLVEQQSSLGVLTGTPRGASCPLCRVGIPHVAEPDGAQHLRHTLGIFGQREIGEQPLSQRVEAPSLETATHPDCDRTARLAAAGD